MDPEGGGETVVCVVGDGIRIELLYTYSGERREEGPAGKEEEL
jgi:hypothetical protein